MNIAVPPHEDDEYLALPCTREAIDDYFRRRGAALKQEPLNNIRYPDEWYDDKNNRAAGMPTGHLRAEGVSSGNVRMVWVSDEET